MKQSLNFTNWCFWILNDFEATPQYFRYNIFPVSWLMCQKKKFKSINSPTAYDYRSKAFAVFFCCFYNCQWWWSIWPKPQNMSNYLASRNGFITLQPVTTWKLEGYTATSDSAEVQYTHRDQIYHRYKTVRSQQNSSSSTCKHKQRVHTITCLNRLFFSAADGEK